MRPFVSLAVLAVCMSTAPAAAQLQVIGRSAAASCYDNAVRRDHYASAMRDCDIALADVRVTRRDRAATLVNRGILQIHRGRPAEALQDFARAEAIHAFDAAILAVNRSSAYIRMNRYHEAIEQTDIAIRAHADNEADAWYNRGVALEATGQLAAAYDSYRQARHLRPEWELPRAELQRFRVSTR